jgi:acetamidase/formamidase
MFASLRFTLEKGRAIPAPQYRTPAPLTPRVDSAPFYGTTGVGGDLYGGSQDAVRAMIDHIATTYDLGREDAYLLCSLVVDLKISEIVDGGQYIVSALLPDAIFSKPSTPPYPEAFRRDALTRSPEQPAGELAVSASLAVDRTA